VLVDGEEQHAFHGVTSVENPLPIDASTLFQFGSTGKTFTATALLRLVEDGSVELDAPVRRYVPELRLKDADVAERVTVLQLLNHTAGWSGDMIEDTGDGDDALEKYVARMADLEQVTPLGDTVSYNNASLSLAGYLIQKVTGTTYERAMKDLLLGPLGLDNTFFFMTEIMTRRFVVGHTRHDDGRIEVIRPWAMPRSAAPAGGMSATVGDQLAWARFHLGDGTATDGTRILSRDLLDRMKVPTVEAPGSAIGDAIGISWLLRDVDGTRIVGHGGTTHGQYSDFFLVPDRGFAFTSMTNCGPNGPELNDAVAKWALKHFLDVDDRDPEPVLLGDDALAQYVGRYETIAAFIDITAEAGRLSATVQIREEMRAALGEDVGEQPPVPLALLAGPGDRYVVPEGGGRGMKGYFTRGADGTVDGIHLGGRLATRTAVVPA
jgi:CubicO group peptidase (beta-lactamase class C family)